MIVEDDPEIQALIDEATWLEAWDEGRAMTAEQAVAYTLDEIG